MANQPKNRRKNPVYDREKANHGILRRTTVVMLVCGVALFLPLFWQLFRLMILEHDKYETQAIDNQTRSTAVSADRGTIYDRNMNVMAASTTVENVFLDPLEINQSKEDKNFIATGLAGILNIDKGYILETLEKTQRRYEVIARKQPLEVSQAIRAFINENELTGIHLEPDSQRYYPFGSMAAQVLGFTNAENKGSEGLEAYYDGLLQGTAGAVITTKGNYETQMLYSYEKYYEATNGSSLVLTIDTTVQYYLEKNLKNAIEKYDVKNGAFGIVMDVNTGAILAMAVEGSYDPNNYLEIIDPTLLAPINEIEREMDQTPRSSARYKELLQEYNNAVRDARLTQWRNRCVSDGYEPGSTFKTITLASALEEGVVDLNTWFHCSGSKDYEGRHDTLHCWKLTGHGDETTSMALQNSCNIAFADMGMKLGGDKLFDYMDAFGLMEKTGIDMSGEAYGVFHTKDKLMETAQLTTVAFGQSVKPTPIQMVRAIAAVVNGGYVLKPYVVSEILDENGNVVQKNGRTVLRQAISEDTSRQMCRLMESVVTYGTASNAELPGYHVGGKTGTSEKLDKYDENGELTKERIVSFVGVAPMTDPQYIVLVALDTPSDQTGIYISGGVMAAPVVRDIFSDTLVYLGVQPDYSSVDMSAVNVQMPDLRDLSLEEAKELLREQTLNWKLVGSGDTVTGTIPEGGSLLPGMSTTILYLGEEVPTDLVKVPSLKGLNKAMAKNVVSGTGLYLQTKGSSATYALITDQDPAAGTMVPRGTTVTAEFTDGTIED